MLAVGKVLIAKNILAWGDLNADSKRTLRQLSSITAKL
jgi:hypothetical protein